MVLIVHGPALAHAATEVGTSGWRPTAPVAQASNLTAVAFAGATGYAVGDLGAVLKTTNAGRSWTPLDAHTLQPLTMVQTVGGETVVAGGDCTLRRSHDGGRHFTALAFADSEFSCRDPLVALSLLAPTVGYALTSDGQLLTMTADDRLAARGSVPGTHAAGGHSVATAMTFATATIGVAATSAGELWRTSDGGTTWTLVESGRPAIDQQLFPDATHGYAVGENGLLLRSDDGGLTWTVHDLHVGAPTYTGIACGTIRLCMLVTAGGGEEISIDEGLVSRATTLVRTTDGGETAGTKVAPVPHHALAAIGFASPTRVVALGGYGATASSDDGGTTFHTPKTRLSFGLYELAFAGPGRGDALVLPWSGFGDLQVTHDKGRSWQTIHHPGKDAVTDVALAARSRLYVVDRSFRVQRTLNGGRSWRTLATGYPRRIPDDGDAVRETTAPPSVVASDARHVLVLGRHGIRRSSDGGRTFTAVHAGALGHQLATIAWQRGRTLIAAGSALARSQDGGRTWQRLRTLSPHDLTMPTDETFLPRSLHVAFCSARVGLLADRRGLWRTTNAGRRWTALPSVGGTPEGVACGSPHDAYVSILGRGAGRDVTLLHSADLGATWQPELIGDAIAAGPLSVATGTGTDWAFAGDYFRVFAGGDASGTAATALLVTTSGGATATHARVTLTTAHRTLHHGGTITLRGQLAPAVAGQPVVLAMRAAGTQRWSQQTVAVAADGTFSAPWRVGPGTSQFVARSLPTASGAGAGSRALTVEVR
jgi:photosystem II stability/assembly factor-like uncharacterized protein